MADKFDFIIEEDNELKTYSYIDEKGEISVEIDININVRQKPSLMINLRGVDPAYNPLFYFINRLILQGKFKNLNQLHSIVLPDRNGTVTIPREYISSISNINTPVDSHITINFVDIGAYPEILEQFSYLDNKDEEEEEEE